MSDSIWMVSEGSVIPMDNCDILGLAILNCYAAAKYEETRLELAFSSYRCYRVGIE